MIQVAIYFFFGFLASFLGSLPVGPVNLSMVDTHIHGGNREASKFSISASLVEVGQALVAIYFGAALFERIALQTIFNIFVVVLLIGFVVHGDINPPIGVEDIFYVAVCIDIGQFA